MQRIISIFKEKNLNIFLICLFLFVNSGFYIKYLPAISPVYIFLFITLFITMLYIIKKQRIALAKSALMGLITIFYILSTQFILQGRPEAILGSVATMSFYILGTMYLPKLSSKQVFFIAEALLLFSLIIYGADTLYRLSLFNFDILKLLNGTSFYAMKVRCWLYGDTNPLAIATASLFFLALYLYMRTKQIKYLFFIIIYALGTFLTFSRSVIIAICVTLAIFFLLSIFKHLLKTKNYTNYIYKIKIKTLFYYIILIISFILSMLMGYKIINYLMTDGSFLSKLDLLNVIVNFFKNANIQDILLGIGFNNGRIKEFSHIGYAHAYLTTYICETGIIGYCLVTSFLLSIALETKKTIMLIFAFFIMGISYIGHAQLHLFYTVLALIYYFEKFYISKKGVCTCR